MEKSRSPRRYDDYDDYYQRDRYERYDQRYYDDYYDRGYDRGYDRRDYDRRDYERRDYDRRDYDRRDYYDRYDAPKYDRYASRRPRSPRQKRSIIRGTDEEREMSKCLFIGNLPYSFVEQDVRDMFGKFGQLESVSIPIDRYTGRNKGFAFVAFEGKSGAQQAKDEYDQTTIEGRQLRIDWDIGRDRKEQQAPSTSQSNGVERD